jgi:hypothetical protein
VRTWPVGQAVAAQHPTRLERVVLVEFFGHTRPGQPCRPAVESVLWRERFAVMALDLGFRRFVVCIWAVETHSLCGPGFVNVGAQHVPTLAQVQHPMVPLSSPTLRCDSDPFFLRHSPHSQIEVSHGQVAKLHKNE